MDKPTTLQGNTFFLVEETEGYAACAQNLWYKLPEKVLSRTTFWSIPLTTLRGRDENGDVRDLEWRLNLDPNDSDYTGVQVSCGSDVALVPLDPSVIMQSTDWVNLAFTFGGGRIKVYLNGELSGEGEIPDPQFFGGECALVGFEAYDQRGAQIILADVRIWDGVKSDRAFKAAYRDVTENEGKNVLPWGLPNE